DMSAGGNIARPDTATAIGAVKDGQMLIFQMRCSLNGHSTANVIVGVLNLLLREAQVLQNIKLGIGQLLFAQPQLLFTELFTQRPLIKGKFYLKAAWQRFFNGFKLLTSKTLFAQTLLIDMRAAIQCAVAFGIVNNSLSLFGAVTQVLQCFVHGLIDNRKVCCAGQIFEFKQG